LNIVDDDDDDDDDDDLKGNESGTVYPSNKQKRRM